MNNSIKLIAVDLDGTLLNDQSQVSDRTRACIKKLDDCGIQFTIATGRIHSRLPESLRKLPELKWGIMANGAEIYDFKQKILKAINPLSPAVTPQILAILDKYPVFLEIYAEGEAYTDHKRMQYYSDSLYHPNKVADMAQSRNIIADLSEFIRQRTISKLILPKIERTIIKQLSDELATITDICLSSSAPQNLEINHRTCTKVSGITFLAEQFQIKPSEIMVFGDEANDIEMLKNFPNSVAMANAPEYIKKLSAYTTELTNNEDGIADFINKHILRY